MAVERLKFYRVMELMFEAEVEEQRILSCKKAKQGTEPVRYDCRDIYIKLLLKILYMFNEIHNTCIKFFKKKNSFPGIRVLC